MKLTKTLIFLYAHILLTPTAELLAALGIKAPYKSDQYLLKLNLVNSSMGLL